MLSPGDAHVEDNAPHVVISLGFDLDDGLAGRPLVHNGASDGVGGDQGLPGKVVHRHWAFPVCHVLRHMGFGGGN